MQKKQEEFSQLKQNISNLQNAQINTKIDGLNNQVGEKMNNSINKVGGKKYHEALMIGGRINSSITDFLTPLQF